MKWYHFRNKKMTNGTRQNNSEGQMNLISKMVGVASELVRAWKFRMPTKETPAMTTREHWNDLKNIVQREGILEAVKYDLSLSFRSRQKNRYDELNHYFIPSHPLNVKRVYNAWSKLGKVSPDELYDYTTSATQEGSLQYEAVARRVAAWYGFPTDRIDQAVLQGKQAYSKKIKKLEEENDKQNKSNK